MAALTSDREWVRLERVPDALLDVEPAGIHRVLPGPTLIQLAGRLERPLFVSVLLHGNETTGLQAAQKLLRKYVDRVLPRGLCLFFGNIAATRLGLRRLDHQVDFNRIWPGTECTPCDETRMAQQIVDEMAQHKPFASVDVHNNTGRNPHYSCIHQMDARTQQLAAMFGRLCIHSTYPKGTLSEAFASLCPSVTVECGKPAQDFGAEHAFEYLDACLHLAEVPAHAVAAHDLELYESVARVYVDPELNFGFARQGTDLDLIPDLDRLNFTEVPAGFVFGRVKGERLPLRVMSGSGLDVADEYFSVEKGHLILRRPTMPSMLTMDERVIRQDCLGYLMERRNRPEMTSRS